MLGYVLDPDRIGATEEELLSGLLETTTTNTVFEAVERWSGRWILLLDDGTDTILFHDALGTRQVHYHRTVDGCWIATQPHLLEEVLPLQRDPEATAYRKSLLAHEYVHIREYARPGESSEYVGGRRLLPNHYLNLQTGTAIRFWPHTRLTPATMEDVTFDVGVESLILCN